MVITDNKRQIRVAGNVPYNGKRVKLFEDNSHSQSII